MVTLMSACWTAWPVRNMTFSHIEFDGNVITFSFFLQCWLMPSLFDDRFEHPAGGYKKIFETCEELAEPLPATVTGLFIFNL